MKKTIYERYIKIKLLKVSDKEKNVKSRWRKKILHIMRKMIINTGDFMSKKNARKKVEEKYL